MNSSLWIKAAPSAKARTFPRSPLTKAESGKRKAETWDSRCRSGPLDEVLAVSPSTSAVRRPVSAFRFPLSALSLLLLLAGCSSTALKGPDPSEPFAKEIQQFLDADRTNPPPKNGILFVGSSSIRLWKTLAQDFPGQPVFNRGFGGSQIIDSVHYADLIITPYRPKRIVIYAGGNDINAGKSPEQVYADFQILIDKIRKRLPQTEINYISIAPNPARWAQVDKVRATNRMIEDYARRHSKVTYIDVFSHMLGPDGQPKPDIYIADRLHMNENGYALWKQLIAPYLK